MAIIATSQSASFGVERFEIRGDLIRLARTWKSTAAAMCVAHGGRCTALMQWEESRWSREGYAEFWGQRSWD